MVSIKRWRHQPHRVRDDKGLSESGYVWDERRLDFYLVLGFFSFAGLIGFLVASADRGVIYALPALFLGVFVAGLMVWYLKHPRVVIFRRDGAILTPHGVRRQFGVRKLKCQHWEVASIELCGQGEDCGVMLYTSEGVSVLLADDMHQGDARLVAVQLTKALREMRESMAVLASQKPAAPQKRNFVLVH